jgi:hypothetical protein
MAETTFSYGAQITNYEVTPVAYSLAGAAVATGLSTRSLQSAVNRGDLIPRYFRTKMLIERDELIQFIRSLPTERRSR